MPVLSQYARMRKIMWFFDPLPTGARVLEVGCGSGWVGEYLRKSGCRDYVGIDLQPPADIVGDVRNWRQLGVAKESFDIVVAFEVVEHVDIWQACYDLLSPGGRMFVTTPLPHRDWILKCLEVCGLNQPRTSPHDHLTYLECIKLFKKRQIAVIAQLSQWGVFTK